MQRDWITRLKSRKFISAVVYAVVVCIAEITGQEVAYEIYYAVGGVLGLYILGESLVDASK